YKAAPPTTATPSTVPKTVQRAQRGKPQNQKMRQTRVARDNTPKGRALPAAAAVAAKTPARPAPARYTEGRRSASRERAPRPVAAAWIRGSAAVTQGPPWRRSRARIVQPKTPAASNCTIARNHNPLRQ